MENYEIQCKDAMHWVILDKRSNTYIAGRWESKFNAELAIIDMVKEK